MNKYKIPEDLKSYSAKVVFKRVLPFVALEALFLAFILLFGDSFFGTDYPQAKIAWYIAFLALPFPLTKFPWSLFDKTFFATVEDVNVKSVVTTRKDIARAALAYKTALIVTMRTDDGKIKEISVGEMINKRGIIDANQKFGTLLSEKYKKGDRIFHLYGTKQYVKLPNENDSTVDCPVCGRASDKHNRYCSICGHSLVK